MSTAVDVISIKLNECRNLRSAQGDKFTFFSRVELGDAVLGESVRGDCEGVELEVTTSCNVNNPECLAKFAKNPLFVKFLEVLPKDKKSKEEKTAVLCQATIDILPFVRKTPSQAESTFITLSLHPPSLDGSHPAGSGETPNVVEPEVDITITIPQSLRKARAIDDSNILSLRLRSVHSLPDSWQPGTFPYTFTVAFPLPSLTESSTRHRIDVKQGALKFGPDKDSGAMATNWKWPGNCTGKASYISECPIEPHPLEDETGELMSKQDVTFRQHSEFEKPCVSWCSEHRAWLTASGTRTLLSQLSQCPVWPVEIGRYSIPQITGKGKFAKEEDPVLSHHAVAYLDLAPLLYPGATNICGAYTLHPFSGSEVMSKIKRNYSPLLTQAANPSLLLTKKNQAKRVPSSVINSADGVDPHSESSDVNSETHLYVDAKTYLVLEIVLEKPLIAQRPASALFERINEYISPRPPFPRIMGGVERAMLNYHEQTSDVASILLSEFRELFGESVSADSLSQDQDSVNERRRKLLFHLNSSGKYHAFKEQLKVSVVRLVREKFLNKAKTQDKAQLQSFLSELYVFLVEQMHTGLAKVINLEGSAPPTPSTLDFDLLKRFAIEAEQCGEFELAHTYYKERVAGADHIAEHWFDYGVFSLLISDMDHSEQCFKEAISLNQPYVSALLLYGMVCCLDEKFSEAEHFFELVTTIEPTNIIAWIMRGLHYQLAGNGVYQNMCFQEATKLNQGQSSKTFLHPTSQKRSSISQPPAGLSAGLKPIASMSKTSISSRTGGNTKQLPLPATMSAGVASGETVVLQVPSECGSVGTDIPLNQQSKIGDESTLSFNNEANSMQSDQPDQGPTHHTLSTHNLTSGSGAGVKSVESDLTDVEGAESSGCVEESANRSSAFLQTAMYLLDIHALKFAEMSLAHELASCEGDPSPLFQVSEARLHMHRELYDKAKSCLRKAVALNIQDSNAWSLLGHAHYLTGDLPTAKDAYERTINFVTLPTHIHTVYMRLADIYLQEGEYKMARETFLRACRKCPTSRTWRGVGVACYQLGDLVQSEDALCEANILNNLDSVVWAYLTMVCLKTKRSAEAEQAFKFAVKTGLSDAALISEITALQEVHAPSMDLQLTPLPTTPV